MALIPFGLQLLFTEWHQASSASYTTIATTDATAVAR